MEIPEGMSFDLAKRIIDKFGSKPPSFTDKLFMYLSQAFEHTPEEERDGFIDDVVDGYRKARALVEEIGHLKPAHKRVALLHKIVDEEITKAIAKEEEKPTCKRGCSICCHLNVDISNDEARVMRFLYKGQNSDRLKKQAKVKDYENYPSILGWQDSMCVFLEKGECSIYEHRPVACRAHLTVDDPSSCDPFTHPGGRLRLLANVKAEFLKTVMYELQGCDNMARQLLKK